MPKELLLKETCNTAPEPAVKDKTSHQQVLLKNVPNTAHETAGRKHTKPVFVAYGAVVRNLGA